MWKFSFIIAAIGLTCGIVLKYAITIVNVSGSVRSSKSIAALKGSSSEWIREQPVVVRPTVPEGLHLEGRLPDWPFQPFGVKEGELSLGLVFHLMGMGGGDDLNVGSETVSMRGMIMDESVGSKFLSAPPIVKTEAGLKFVTGGGGSVTNGDESHRDQGVYVLSKLGYGRNSRLRFSSGEVRFEGAVQEVLNAFTLHQSELAWSASVIAMNLNPVDGWVNRFGEKLDVGLIVEEMMRRDCSKTSCGGTHVLISLTEIRAIDQRSPLMRAGLRKELERFLREKVEVSVRTQKEEGGWDQNWASPDYLAGSGSAFRTTLNPKSREILMLGHMLEWYLLLPMEEKPSLESIQRALTRLEFVLRGATQEEFLSDFCPYSHAFSVLRRVSESSLSAGNPGVEP